MDIPKEDGFYWAMWQISDDNTEPQHDYTPCRIWEVVELYTADEGERRTYLGGIPGSQSAENFHFHPDRLEAPPLKWRDHTKGAQEDAFRRYRSMTPAQREEFLANQKRGK